VYSADTKRANYRGLVICGSVWDCPVCSATITEFRRRELSKAMENYSDRAVLVTLTLSHHKEQRLKPLIGSLKGAYQMAFSGRWFETFKEKWSLSGTIKATEVTYGKNGWHPHYHILMFIDANVSIEQVESEFAQEIRTRWLYCLSKHDAYASMSHGVDVRGVYADIAEYVAKYAYEPADELGWNVVSELTKSPSKTASGHGKTPFQLLIAYRDGDNRAADLFLEYSSAFYRSHQLEWSKGLKKLMGLDETDDIPDEIIAEQLPEDSRLLCRLDRDQWKAVLKANLRAELLDVASKGDVEVLWEWLTSIGVKMSLGENIQMLYDEAMNRRV